MLSPQFGSLACASAQQWPLHCAPTQTAIARAVCRQLQEFRYCQRSSARLPVAAGGNYRHSVLLLEAELDLQSSLVRSSVALIKMCRKALR